MSEFESNLVCPICKTNNYCKVNSKTGCWCFDEKVPKALIDSLATDAINKHCICINCIKNFKASQSKQ